MDLFSLFAMWLMAFSVAFTFLPVLQILEWRRRGTADGFSSVGLVLPVLMMSCWMRHGFMTNDNMNIYLNGFNLFFFAGYIAMFAYYQPQRKYLYGQLLTLATIVYGVFTYVDLHSPEDAPNVMGSIAAGMQILGLAGGIYEIKRVISFGHTEYLPASFQFAFLLLSTQWFIFGMWAANYYIAVANAAAMVLSVVTISMYVIYPPLTWRVPILGTGPQQKKKE